VAVSVTVCVFVAALGNPALFDIPYFIFDVTWRYVAAGGSTSVAVTA